MKRCARCGGATKAAQEEFVYEMGDAEAAISNIADALTDQKEKAEAGPDIVQIFLQRAHVFLQAQSMLPATKELERKRDAVRAVAALVLQSYLRPRLQDKSEKQRVALTPALVAELRRDFPDLTDVQAYLGLERRLSLDLPRIILLT